MDKGWALDVVHPEFSKASNAVSNNLAVTKLMTYEVDKCMIKQVENLLN